jgi:hypothetical protein
MAGEPQSRVWLEKENAISLRTAIVVDDGDVVSFQLMPNFASSIPGQELPWPRVWLFRHARSEFEEQKLKNSFPCIQHDLVALSFQDSHRLSLLWDESGHSAAIYLDGQPWAFVAHETGVGYSKGILDNCSEQLWNQELFERTFGS